MSAGSLGAGWSKARSSGLLAGIRTARELTVSQGALPDRPFYYSMTVGIYIPVWNGGGTLTITRGAIVLRPGRLLRGLTGVNEIVHTSPDVTMIRPRIAPPWINTHLLIEGA